MRPIVFVDSSAFVAMLRRGDLSHAAAEAIMRRLASDQAVLVTSNYVVAETHALVLRYLGYGPGRTYLQQLERSRGTTVFFAEPSDESAARQIIYRYTDKDFSLADAVSFALMERFGISQAFTFDHHFAQYGFTILAP